MACDHQTGIFYEVVEAIHTRKVVDGVLQKDSMCNEIGDGLYHMYECVKCNKVWKFQLTNNLPKWLQNLHLKAYTDNRVEV